MSVATTNMGIVTFRVFLGHRYPAPAMYDVWQFHHQPHQINWQYDDGGGHQCEAEGQNHKGHHVHYENDPRRLPVEDRQSLFLKQAANGVDLEKKNQTI